MELDHLKAMWSNENVAETPEISTEKQKEIHLPLEKIRKNMRNEFYWTAVFFIFIILFFALVDMHFFKFSAKNHSLSLKSGCLFGSEPSGCGIGVLKKFK